jgi:hypothetical protein
MSPFAKNLILYACAAVASYSLISCASTNQALSPKPAISDVSGVLYWGSYDFSNLHEDFVEISGASDAQRSNELMLVSDQPGSETKPQRIYRVSLELNASQKPVLTILKNIPIAAPIKSYDMEAIADIDDTNYAIASEGSPALRKSNNPTLDNGKYKPQLIVVNSTGKVMRELDFPSSYALVFDSKGKPKSGVLPNRSVEAMTTVPFDGSRLTTDFMVLASSEFPLAQQSNPNLLLWTMFKAIPQAKALTRVAEFEYLLESHPSAGALGFMPDVQDLGLTEIKYLKPDLYLALERGFYKSKEGSQKKNTAKVFVARTSSQSKHVQKTLLLDLGATVKTHHSHSNKDPVDNCEAMALLPKSDLDQWLVLVTDNNASPSQRTLIHVFSMPKSIE